MCPDHTRIIRPNPVRLDQRTRHSVTVRPPGMRTGWDVGEKEIFLSALQYCLMRHLRLIAGLKGKHDYRIDYGLASQTVIKPHSGL